MIVLPAVVATCSTCFPVPVAGLALDYCVAFTCKDAAIAGFNTFCIRDASRGIAPASIESELAAMAAVGVHLVERADDVPTIDVETAANKHVIGGATAHVDFHAAAPAGAPGAGVVA